MALPYLREHGWEAEVLAVKPEFVEAVHEPELLETLPVETSIHRVSAFPQKVTRMVGFGGLAFRAGWHLQKEGERLLRSGRYDAVYFSSTVFATFRWGPIWKKKYGIPYFVDFQDPWWTHYYEEREVKPPGGWIKHGLIQRSARKNEGSVVRGAVGITCVSPAYTEMLRKRYPDTEKAKFIELPFGASERDFQIPCCKKEYRGLENGSHDVWRYIGRGGPDMGLALRIFSTTLGKTGPKSFRLELIGTSYAVGAQAERTMVPGQGEKLAEGTVIETPERIGYLESICKLKEANRLVLFGSDDPGYTASKLYNYILARRPLLVICREESSVARIVRETRAGELITFGDRDIGYGISDMGSRQVKKEWREAMGRWLAMDPAKEPPTDWQAFEPYTAKRMTEKLCRFFDERLAQRLENLK